MTLPEFLRQTNLEHSLLIGYYGGGNYGDELLLEVLGNMLRRQGVSNVTITYQHPEGYHSMHHDFGYRLSDIHSKGALVRTALRHKNILIGGGGLWGVDMNTNTFFLSLFLFVCRWLLGKKVYLLGVGYYSSTTRQGRMAAWLAAKAANVIIARDRESIDNFKCLSRHVHADTDIAWHAKDLELADYKHEVEQLQERLPIGGKTLLLALRRPQAKSQQAEFVRFNQLIKTFVAANPDRPFILLMLESESKDPTLYEQARTWRRRHRHLRLLEAPFNPLTLFLYIQKNRKRLAVIAPQLHLIMTAHLQTVPFMPIVYDNKVHMLLEQIGVPNDQQLPIKTVTQSSLQSFADSFFGGTN